MAAASLRGRFAPFLLGEAAILFREFTMAFRGFLVTAALEASHPLMQAGRFFEGLRRLLGCSARAIVRCLRPAGRLLGIFNGDWLTVRELTPTNLEFGGAQCRLLDSGPG